MGRAPLDAEMWRKRTERLSGRGAHPRNELVDDAGGHGERGARELEVTVLPRHLGATREANGRRSRRAEMRAERIEPLRECARVDGAIWPDHRELVLDANERNGHLEDRVGHEMTVSREA